MRGTLDTLRLVLVSSSPRREELLADSGLDVEAMDAAIEPVAVPPSGLPPAQRAEAGAYFRARAVLDRLANVSVVATDTVVAVGGRVFGPPAGRMEAEGMLRALSGRRFAIITGVAVVEPVPLLNFRRLLASETSYITLRPLSDWEMRAYLGSGRWIGWPGACAFDPGDRFMLAVEGDAGNVQGLPVDLIERMLMELRARPEAHKVA